MSRRIEDTPLYERLLAHYRKQSPTEARARLRTKAQIAHLYELALNGKNDLSHSARTHYRRTGELWDAELAPVEWPHQLRLFTDSLGLTDADELMRLLIGINNTKIRTDSGANSRYGWLVNVMAGSPAQIAAAGIKAEVERATT